jgi:hypothetical protein
VVHDNGVGLCIHAAESHTKTISEDGECCFSTSGGHAWDQNTLRRCCVLHGCHGISLHRFSMTKLSFCWTVFITASHFLSIDVQHFSPLCGFAKQTTAKFATAAGLTEATAHTAQHAQRGAIAMGPCNELYTSLTW